MTTEHDTFSNSPSATDVSIDSSAEDDSSDYVDLTPKQGLPPSLEKFIGCFRPKNSLDFDRHPSCIPKPFSAAAIAELNIPRVEAISESDNIVQQFGTKKAKSSLEIDQVKPSSVGSEKAVVEEETENLSVTEVEELSINDDANSLPHEDDDDDNEVKNEGKAEKEVEESEEVTVTEGELESNDDAKIVRADAKSGVKDIEEPEKEQEIEKPTVTGGELDSNTDAKSVTLEDENEVHGSVEAENEVKNIEEAEKEQEEEPEKLVVTARGPETSDDSKSVRLGDQHEVPIITERALEINEGAKQVAPKGNGVKILVTIVLMLIAAFLLSSEVGGEFLDQSFGMVSDLASDVVEVINTCVADIVRPVPAFLQEKACDMMGGCFA